VEGKSRGLSAEKLGLVAPERFIIKSPPRRNNLKAEGGRMKDE
jgi:hypothetical protein